MHRRKFEKLHAVGRDRHSERFPGRIGHVWQVLLAPEVAHVVAGLEPQKTQSVEAEVLLDRVAVEKAGLKIHPQGNDVVTL